MSNKMKCYVCYFNDGSEGCSIPEKVVWYEKDAKAFVKHWYDKKIYSAEYKEFEIE
jgi:hypothetical protein